MNTGRIDDRVCCVREFVANIFFYSRDGVTIMIDAGYNYSRLKEKMRQLGLDPSAVRQILITHQDTGLVGAVERDGQIFGSTPIDLYTMRDRLCRGDRCFIIRATDASGLRKH